MRFIPITCAGLLVAGCADPKAANDENFAKAINAYLDKHPMCVDAPEGSVKPAGSQASGSAFPAYVEVPARGRTSTFAYQTRYLDALASAGLLSTKTGTIDREKIMGNGTETVPVRVYDLTDKGQQALTKRAEASAFGDEQFCYGTPEVREITQFTEPGAMMGVTMSAVSYTYRLKDQADWATAPTMQEAHQALKRATAADASGKTQVILTNNGWVDSRDAKL